MGPLSPAGRATFLTVAAGLWGGFLTFCPPGLRAASWLTCLVTAPPDWRAGLARAHRPGGHARGGGGGLMVGPRTAEDGCNRVTWKTAGPGTPKAACPHRRLVGPSVLSYLFCNHRRSKDLFRKQNHPTDKQEGSEGSDPVQ